MVKRFIQSNEKQKATGPQIQQQPNRFLIIAVVLLVIFFIALFIAGPNVGLNLPCHGGIQSIPNATITTPLP
jgi:hypothetical protein